MWNMYSKEACSFFVKTLRLIISILDKYQLKIYQSFRILEVIPVTGFPLASVTATDWTCWVTGLPLASE